tara:strand:- start:398 stop:916 length:519 start_codon:yes stop_codon:yes gene_type:complete
MNIFTILSVASSIGSAFASMQQAAAMQAYYDAQADVTRLQYEAKRIEAREQGVEALKNTNRAVAAIVAKGAAGGILTTSGSALLGQTISIAEGATDLRTAQLNQEIISNMGNVQYRNLQLAGDAAQAGGILSALAGLGTDIVNIQQGGLFDKPSAAQKRTGYKQSIPAGGGR